MRRILRHTGLLQAEYTVEEVTEASRRIYQRWPSSVALEQVQLAEVHLAIYPRGFFHERMPPHNIEAMKNLFETVGIMETQVDHAYGALQHREAQQELRKKTLDFCLVPYLASLVVLVANDPENREEYLEQLCSLVGADRRPHWALLLLLSSLHYADEVAELLVSTLEAHGAGSCAVGPRHVNLAPAAVESRGGRAAPSKVRATLWTGHVFAFDGLVASWEAATSMGLEWEGAILNYDLATRWPAAREQCEQLQDLLGLKSPLCRRSSVEDLVQQCTEKGIGTQSGCSVHDVRSAIDKLHREAAVLRDADLLICGYPYALCAIFGTSQQLQHLPMLVLVHGAGSMTEYADDSLTPWILQTFKRWMAAPTKTTDGKALRKVVFNDRMDVVVARVAFGEASQPQLVEFPARYVLQLAGGVQCHRRMREPGFRQLLLWRSQSTFPAQTALMIERVFAGALRGRRWTVEQMQVSETREFRYEELQNFSAVLQIPWDFGLVSFQEVIALGIPVLMPSNHYMHTLVTTVFLSRANMTEWNLKWKRRYLQLAPDLWAGWEPPPSNMTLGISE
ncbi:unnamed protein product, partial [Symbiodinium natans]